MKTCSTRSKRRDQCLSDYRKTSDKRNPSYTLTTINNIFHGKLFIHLFHFNLFFTFPSLSSYLGRKGTLGCFSYLSKTTTTTTTTTTTKKQMNEWNKKKVLKLNCIKLSINQFINQSINQSTNKLTYVWKTTKVLLLVFRVTPFKTDQN